METAVKSRMKAFLAHKKLSQGKFEQSVGLSNGYVNALKNSVHANMLRRICSVYPELNADWLLYGEGEMLNDSKVQTGDVNGQNVINNSSTGNVKQVASSGNETKLLQEISDLKDRLMKMQQMVIRAYMASTPEEKNEILKEVMNL